MSLRLPRNYQSKGDGASSRRREDRCTGFARDGCKITHGSFCSLLGMAERDVIKRQPSGQVALDPEALWGQDGAVRPVSGGSHSCLARMKVEMEIEGSRHGATTCTEITTGRGL